MPPFILCADFTLFPDDTVLGPNFSFAGFDFDQLGGSPPLFVNITGAERGLQFPPQGVEIALPIPRSLARLRIGTFNGPVDIAALDSSRTTINTKTIPDLNSYVDTSIRAASDISSVVLRNGGHDGILVRICVAI